MTLTHAGEEVRRGVGAWWSRDPIRWHPGRIECESSAGAHACVCVCVRVCVWLAVADVLDRRIISCGRPGESANTGNTRTLYRSVNAVQLS